MRQEDITKEEVKRALKLLNNGKTRGINGVVRKMVKSGGETILEWIWKVYMESMEKCSGAR